METTTAPQNAHGNNYYEAKLGDTLSLYPAELCLLLTAVSAAGKINSLTEVIFAVFLQRRGIPILLAQPAKNESKGYTITGFIFDFFSGGF